MRLPDFLSAVTLNVVLALFSMLMAIVALGLLAFVLAKDTYLQKRNSTYHARQNQATRECSAVPDHFLQLNTLMFQKKPKNNLITEMPALPLSGMHMMSSTGGNEGVEQELSPLQAESEVASNKVSSVLRAQRSASEGHETTQHTTELSVEISLGKGRERYVDYELYGQDRGREYESDCYLHVVALL